MHRLFLSKCRKPLASSHSQALFNKHNQRSIAAITTQYHNPSLSSTAPANRHPATPFSTVATPPPPSSSTDQSNSNQNKDNTNDKKKDDSNIFLDNLGKIFLSTIALVLLSLLRSNKGNNAKAALREDIETYALLDPLEIEDLRCVNDHFTKEVWDEILQEFVGRRTLTYGAFMRGVLTVLRNRYGEGATIQFGHLMDRVVVKELERVVNSKKTEGESVGEVELPVSFLLTALSLALHSTVADRVKALYDVMILMSGDRPGDNNLSREEQTVSMNQVEQMIQHLQSTCQLVPDAQIVPTVSNIPFQAYRVGNGAELTRRACEGLDLMDGKDTNDDVAAEHESARVALDDFYAILKSRSVCAWGECYVKKTDRMATSDR
jgi:hypothetical protein